MIGMARTTLTVPGPLMDAIEKKAKEKDVSRNDVIRTALHLGLQLIEANDSETTQIVVRTNGVEQTLVIGL